MSHVHVPCKHLNSEFHVRVTVISPDLLHKSSHTHVILSISRSCFLGQTFLVICMHLYAGQLEREERERATVRQSISRLQHEMSRLSSLISEKSGQQHRLEQNNVLMQNDIVHALKVQYTHIYICMH